MDTLTTPRSTTRRPLLAGLLAGLGAVALVAAGCSSSGYGTSAKTTTTTTASPAAAASDPYGAGSASTAAASGSAVSLATTSLGSVVVDSAGRTLYLYEKDTGPTSTCVDACAKAWPAATVSGTPTASADITATVTTFTRADGSTQIVLAGHPLYRFAADTAPGEVGGQDVGGVWYAVGADGQKIG